MRTHLLPCLSNNDAMSILFRDMMHIAKCIKIASIYFSCKFATSIFATEENI